MIQFTNSDYPNFHIDIHNDQLTVTVTLNISVDMKPHLSPNLVVKAKKHLVFMLKSTTPLSNLNEQKILSIANTLINKAMISCREAKQKVLSSQIEKIKKQSPRLTSNNLVKTKL